MSAMLTEVAVPKKGLAVASLVLGIVSLPTLAGVIVGGLAGFVLGVLALVLAGRHPDAYGGKGLAIAGILTSAASFLMIPVLGIAAGVAIPGLLRARTAAVEAVVLGDLRAIMSGESAYSAMNGGYFDTMECLVEPEACMRDAGASATSFAPASILQQRTGYLRTFHAGPAVPRGDIKASGLSPSSLVSYAIVAVPTDPASGGRSFCADSTGRLCETADGSSPAAVKGACPADWTDVR
jgi:hypothetical protein